MLQIVHTIYSVHSAVDMQQILAGSSYCDRLSMCAADDLPAALMFLDSLRQQGFQHTLAAVCMSVCASICLSCTHDAHMACT